MSVSAMITLYNPDKNNKTNIDSISKQCDRIFLLDNSSNKIEFELPYNCIYIWDGSNYGIPLAYNKVLKDSKYSWKNDDFIIFFDQDSVIQDNHIFKLVKEYKTVQSLCNKCNKIIGCLGPAYLDRSSGNTYSNDKNKEIVPGVSDALKVITSSMLLQYKNIKEIGFWNEDIFLDLADWDLCWRLKKKGYLTCITSNIFMSHQLGSGVVKKGILKSKKGIPIREYYQTRDCIKLLNKDYVPFSYWIRFIGMLTVRPILHFLLLDKKRERLNYIKRGFCDGIKHINGVYK